MCWSATADVVAGTAVSAVGIAALASVRRPRDAVLAALPLTLGVHQLVEAVVWRGEEGAVSAGTAELARNVWAFIAFPLLPVLVPLGVLLAVWPEAIRRTRVILGVFLAVGTGAAAVLGHTLATNTVNAEIHGHTVQYAVGIPEPDLVIAAYLLATLGALVASGDRQLTRFGVVAFAGAAACGVLWMREFASTWCALAAVASVMVLAWVRGRSKESAPAARGRQNRARPAHDTDAYSM